MSSSSPVRFIEKLKKGIHPSSSMSKCTIKPSTNGRNEGPALPYRMGCLTPSMVEEARLELNETEESRQIAVKELMQLVEKEEKLVCRTDEGFLLQFLRARKFNVKKAFKLLQNYYSFRKEYSQIYDQTEGTKVQELILRNFIGFLTSRDRNGSIVFLAKIGMWDPEKDPFEQMFRAVSGCLVHSIEDPATQVAGFRVILDARELSWKQLKLFTPQNILLVIRSTQFCFPARYRAIHIFSENKLFNLLWSIAHPFLTMKLKNRITLHGKDVNALQEYIHPAILPMEYGGTQGTFDNSSWVDIMNEDENWLLDMLKYGYK